MKPLLLTLVFLTRSLFGQAVNEVNLDSLIAEAIKANPELEAVKERVAMLDARVVYQGTLPDPVISFRYRESELGINEMMPFPIKLSLRTEIANRERNEAQKLYDVTALKTVKEVKTAYFDLYYLNHALEITRQNRRALEDFSNVLEARYAAGFVPQSDLLKAHVDLSQFIDRELNLGQMQQEARARLNRLLNKPSDNPVGEIREPEDLKLKLELSDLRDRARAKRPELLAATERIKKSDGMVKLSRSEYIPDLEIGLSYMVKERIANAMVGISLPLWWWRKQNAMVKEALAEKAMNRADYESMVNETDYELTDLFTRIEKGDKLTTLYRTTIIPQTRQAYEAAVADYQANKVDFLMVLDNLMSLFMFQDEYYMKRSDYFKDLAELESIVGERFY
jgi:outer membrane protein TolC